MKACPVYGCDVRIHDADIVCRGCLTSVPRPYRDRLNNEWRAFQRSFSATDLAAYDAAARAVIVEAGMRRRPTQMPLDGI